MVMRCFQAVVKWPRKCLICRKRLTAIYTIKCDHCRRMTEGFGTLI